jgi:adenosylhomocysteinase
MKDGAVLSNAGHFDVEVSRPDLEAAAVEFWTRKPNIVGYRLPNGNMVNLLAEGRLVNLAAGNGHPAEIMDMSFAIQAKSLEYLAKQGRGLTPGLYNVPREIDAEVAGMKLEAMGVKIDALTEEQKAYLESSE